MIRHASNGSQITAAANVTNNNNSDGKNDISIITHDHLGNPWWLGQSDINHLIKNSCLHGKITVASYSCMYFILTQYSGYLLRSLQWKRSRSIGINRSKIWNEDVRKLTNLTLLGELGLIQLHTNMYMNCGSTIFFQGSKGQNG